jgi:hypothetical protein
MSFDIGDVEEGIDALTTVGDGMNLEEEVAKYGSSAGIPKFHTGPPPPPRYWH